MGQPSWICGESYRTEGLRVVLVPNHGGCSSRKCLRGQLQRGHQSPLL